MKILSITVLFIALIVLQSQYLSGNGSAALQEKKKEDYHLKVLPKNISEEELINVMKVWSWSLGVKCGHCHAGLPNAPGKFDFASDAKPEKQVARDMVKMTMAINQKYIQKIAKKSNEHFENITCVTCHMGKVHPMVSVDSLRAEKQRNAPAPAPAPADTTKK